MLETRRRDPDADARGELRRTFTVTLPKPVDGAEVSIDPDGGLRRAGDSSLAAYTLQVVDATARRSPRWPTACSIATSLYRLNRVPAKGMPNGVVARAPDRALDAGRRSRRADRRTAASSTSRELQVYAKPNGPSADRGRRRWRRRNCAAQLRPGLNKASRAGSAVKNERVRDKVRRAAGRRRARCRRRASMTPTLGKLGKKTFSARPGKYKTGHVQAQGA